MYECNQVLVQGLSSTTEKEFLRQLSSAFGAVEHVTMHRHPKTRAVLGMVLACTVRAGGDWLMQHPQGHRRV